LKSMGYILVEAKQEVMFEQFEIKNIIDECTANYNPKKMFH